MKSTKANAVLGLAVVLALGAGATGGLMYARLKQAPAPAPGPEVASELAQDLNLRPEQREQMKLIWEGVQDRVHRCFTEAQDIQRRREEALVGLLNEQQKAQFAELAKGYAKEFEEVRKRREEAFSSAVEQTRKLLDPKQREQYDKLLQKRLGKRPGDELFGP